MPLPAVVARLNKRWTNRFIEPVVRRFGGYAVVRHTGRRSGTVYRTPIFCFEGHGCWLVALTYGSSTDWVRNVLTSGGLVERDGRSFSIDDATVVDRSVAWRFLPTIVRGALTCLRVNEFLRFVATPRTK